MTAMCTIPVLPFPETAMGVPYVTPLWVPNQIHTKIRDTIVPLAGKRTRVGVGGWGELTHDRWLLPNRFETW